MTRAKAAGLLFDTGITNVPPPSVRLTLDGAPLNEVYPLVPPAPRHAVRIAASIYREPVHIGLQANGDAVPDIGSLRDGSPRWRPGRYPKYTVPTSTLPAVEFLV